jgi:hypothetical protein
MGIYDNEMRKHHDDVADGLTDCDCKVTEDFVWNGRRFIAVKFSDECVDPQIAIDALMR